MEAVEPIANISRRTRPTHAASVTVSCD